MPTGLEPRRRMIVGDPTDPVHTVLYDTSGNPIDVDWDGTYNALTVIDSRIKTEVDDGTLAPAQVLTYGMDLNYAYDETASSWGRMILETDTDVIAAGQTAQLVIPLMQYYDDKLGAWHRWRGDSGSVWTYVVNMPEIDYRDDNIFSVATDRGVAIGGVATSDSVDPNDFGVLKITTDRSLVVTNDNITDGSQKSQMVDAAGNIINSVLDANGDYSLSTALIQNIITSSNNYTTTNLASGATFTGVADETQGVNGIQIFHTADKDCMVYIDQSIDSTFADSTKIYTSEAKCLANEPCARVVRSISPYYRLRITNISDSITTKLETATGMAPILSILPTELSPSGNLQVVSSLRGNENYDRHVWVNPTNEMATSPVYRMVGTNFDGTTKDPNFWTELVANGGSVTQSGGEIELKTSTTSTGWAKYTSVRKSRFVAGSAQLFSGGFNFKTAANFGNTRRVGPYITTDVVNTPQDGFYFQLSSAAFTVNSVVNGTVSSVASGSFNGNKGVNFVPVADTYYNLSIEWIPLGAFFYVNGELLHKMKGAHQSNYMTLPITMENIYTSGAIDVNFETVGMYIARQGELHTNPTSKYLLTGTSVLKYGAGVLKRIIVSDNIGRVILYDNTAASGTIISNIDTAQGSEPAGTIDFDIPFNNGLTIAITNNVGVTTVYE